jgi:hypothetical protein
MGETLGGKASLGAGDALTTKEFEDDNVITL